MNLLGVMENQTSLVWKRKYYEPGTAELYTPLTSENLKLTAIGNLIWMKGEDECAVIEDRVVEESWLHNRIIVTGRFISSYMDRRLIRPKLTFSGKTEVAMRRILTEAYPIPRVELGALQGFTESVSFQATYKNLLTYETKLAKSSGLGYRFRPDFSEKKIIFEVYRGVDRSFSQSRTNRVIFSEMYANLENTVLRENEMLFKNCVYIGGEGSGSERIVESYGTEHSGLDRRELFVDARDLSRDDMTEAEYRQVLLQRGHEKAADYERSSSIECDTDANANFIYKVNYDLGDIVSIRKQAWGITVDLRITEIHEVYESGKMKVVPIFGNPIEAATDWRDD